MKRITLILVSVFVVFSLSSQIKVLSNGKAYLGLLPNLTQDPDNVITFQVFGTGAVGSKGRIAIGDYGRASTGSCNVMISEYGDYDSDKLWLHGKLGTYLTYGDGNSIIGSYDVNNGNKFNFTCDIWSSGIKLTSDERLKTNITKINNSMTNLRRLNGVSYNLLSKDSFGTSKSLSNSTNTTNSIQLNDKETKDKALIEAYNLKLKNTKPKRIGFLAQDLQKIFPELVDKDSTGYFSVDYIGLIPVIVEALKEQDSIISQQNVQIIELMKSIKNGSSFIGREITAADINSSNSTIASLNQNIPNPFNQTTQIGYYLPSSTNFAKLYIYNMNGLQIKSIPIQEKGKGNITIEGSELQPGIYIYTLIADGKEIDTKRMILTQ